MRLLEDVLAEEILSGRVGEGDTAMVDANEEAGIVLPQQKEQELFHSLLATSSE